MCYVTMLGAITKTMSLDVDQIYVVVGDDFTANRTRWKGIECALFCRHEGKEEWELTPELRPEEYLAAPSGTELKLARLQTTG